MKKVLARLLARLPSKLPVTIKELKHFTWEVYDLYDLPESPEHNTMVATLIMHLGTTRTRASKAYFGKSLYKYMANVAALERIKEVKKQAEEMAKKQLEETKAAEGSPVDVQSPQKPKLQEVTA